MKQTIITTLLALVALTGWAQEKCDSIPFIYHSHIYIPVVINDSVKCNVIYDTGAAGMFGVDSVFLSHSAWKPQKMGHAFAGGGAGKTKVRVIADKTRINAGTIVSYEQFVADIRIYYSVMKNVEVIGEAANMLTRHFREEHNELPWRLIVSMRNVLVHGYAQVSDADLWQTATNDIKPLRNILLTIRNV